MRGITVWSAGGILGPAATGRTEGKERPRAGGLPGVWLAWVLRPV